MLPWECVEGLWATKSEGAGLIVRAVSFQDFQPGGLRKTIFSARLCFGRSRSSKVIGFDTNGKRVCDFLLVRHSNLCPISRTASKILQVFCPETDRTHIPP